MPQQPRLELTWIGKEVRPRLEPRILLEDSEKSYHAAERHSDADIFDNMLIHGDNLLALKALEQDFSGKIKCIYIDPPYNTGQALPFYDDGIEHSIWLSLMKERFEILRRLLSSDGVLFCQLNDDEMAYGKILLDEVFGRKNFLNQVSVKMKLTAGASGGGEDKKLKKNIEYILIFCKDKDGDSGFRKFNDIYDEEDLFDVISSMDDDGKSWKYTSILLDKGTFLESRTIYDGSGEEIIVNKYTNAKRTTINNFIKEGKNIEDIYFQYFDRIFSDTNAQTSIRTRIIDEFHNLGDSEILESIYTPKSGRDKGKIVRHYYISKSIRRVIWLKDTAIKKKNKIVKMEKVGTYWDGFALNNLTKEGGVRFPQGKKPESLIKKILELATNPGDLVLDSFLGSGTTAAVAHKMGRRWIGIELGDHCYTHCLPRLQKVINGEDEGGITKTVSWHGGGGFRFYELAPSLIKTDNWGNPVINPRYNPEMLAEALCKLEGFTYAPNPDVFWQQGYSTERDFIYVTTQTLDTSMLEYLNDCVGEERSLLICCGACVAGKAFLDGLERLTVKKIPQAVLNKCEWDHDDYSLNISNLPQAPAVPAAAEGGADQPAPSRRRRTKAQPDNSLLQLLPDKGE